MLENRMLPLTKPKIYMLIAQTLEAENIKTLVMLWQIFDETITLIFWKAHHMLWPQH